MNKRSGIKPGCCGDPFCLVCVLGVDPKTIPFEFWAEDDNRKEMREALIGEYLYGGGS